MNSDILTSNRVDRPGWCIDQFNIFNCNIPRILKNNKTRPGISQFFFPEKRPPIISPAVQDPPPGDRDVFHLLAKDHRGISLLVHPFPPGKNNRIILLLPGKNNSGACFEIKGYITLQVNRTGQVSPGRYIYGSPSLPGTGFDRSGKSLGTKSISTGNRPKTQYILKRR